MERPRAITREVMEMRADRLYSVLMNTETTLPRKTSAGALIMEWRERRRMSQLHLALEAGISQRHLSFLERGRSNPSREMVLLLSDSLSIPLRQRNRILLASGHAPGFSERDIHDPALKPAMNVVQAVLDGHAGKAPAARLHLQQDIPKLTPRRPQRIENTDLKPFDVNLDD